MSLIPHSVPERISQRIGAGVGRLGISPNLLTLMGLAGTAGAATLAAYGLFWQAGLVMLAAGAFDLLDGAVARATGRTSVFGAILDAMSDRLAELAMLFGLLAWFTAPERLEREPVVLLAVTIGGALLVPYARSKAAEFGLRIREGFGTRFERVMILAIGLFAGEVIAVLWILAILTNLTALQRLGLAWWALRGESEPGLDPADDPPDGRAADGAGSSGPVG